MQDLLMKSLQENSLPHFRAVLDHKNFIFQPSLITPQIFKYCRSRRGEFYRALACSKHVSYSDLVDGDLGSQTFRKWVNSGYPIPEYIKTCKWKSSAEDLETQSFEGEVLIDLKRMEKSFKISDKSDVVERKNIEKP